MPYNSTRVFVFRPGGSDDGGPQGPTFFNSPAFQKLLIIGGVILGLYILDLCLNGTASMIRKAIDWGVFVPAMLIALTVHEYAHARMADFLGDPTPRYRGRLSLDPRRHLDLWGTLLLFTAGFGWAKPVPVDPANFRVPSRAMFFVSLSGPVSNLLLALLGGLMLKMAGMSFLLNVGDSLGAVVYKIFCQTFMGLNLSLAFFNLLPVPPLDGHHLLEFFLSPKQKYTFRMYHDVGIFILMILVVFNFIGIILTPLVTGSLELILNLFQISIR